MGHWFYWFIEIKISEENLAEHYVAIFIVYQFKPNKDEYF